MKRRTWISAAIAGPLASALPAAAAAPPPQQPPQAAPPRDEFAPVNVAASPEALVNPAAPRWFSAGEFRALERLCQEMYPAAGNLPGAIEAGVPEFLDFLVSQSPASKQQLYRDGLARLERVKDWAAALRPLNEPWTYHPPADRFARFLREAKDDILQATFNSREWIEARSGGRGGSGTYYLAID